MTIYGKKFVYVPKEFSEEELRVARARAVYAKKGRHQARRFAEAKKRAKQAMKAGDTVMEASQVEDQGEVLHLKVVQAVGDGVRRSLYSPAGFLAHLVKEDEFFLHYLRSQYGVDIFVSTPKRRIHVKGQKSSVVACLSCLKELLRGWHQRESRDE